jgi:hypothetical protein
MVHVVEGYIVYHYYLRFDRGVVHIVVIILSTITVKGLTEGVHVVVLSYSLSLLCKV